MKSVDDAIRVLESWAASSEDHLFERTAAADDRVERLAAPETTFGAIPEWDLPPSLAYALTRFSRALIKWGENIGHDEFIILDPGEIREYNEIVYLPEGVGRGADGPDLSTNHLVAFASAGNEECAFCFDVTQKGPDGEYPVYFHHQDEARARIHATGEWEDPANATPDFPSFAAWLTWVAETLADGGEPEHSYPSAFAAMPGRLGATR